MAITPVAEITNITNPSNITLTPEQKPKIKFSATTSNYFTYRDFNDVNINNGGTPELENIFTLRTAVDLPVLKGATLSADVGGDFNTKYDMKLDRHKQTTLSPICELKGKLDFASVNISPDMTLTAHIGGRVRTTYEPTKTNQLPTQIRGFCGVNLKLNDNHSIYIDGHLTGKHDENGGKTGKYGCWIGYSYKNFWIEEQLNSDGNFSTNAGISFKF